MGKHEWKVACKTPQGGLAGGDDIFVCTHCGAETLEPSQNVDGCPTPRRNVTCPKCYPHPVHTKGKCRFACNCQHGTQRKDIPENILSSQDYWMGGKHQ